MTKGLHGIHVHTVGSCSSETGPFSGAGAHHNPTRCSATAQHAGDLPNLVVNGAGRGHLNTTLAHFTLTDGPTGVFDGDGSALIVHAAAGRLRDEPDRQQRCAHRLRHHPRPLIHRSVTPDRPDRAVPE